MAKFTWIYCTNTACRTSYALERNTQKQIVDDITYYYLVCPKCGETKKLYAMSPELEIKRQTLSKALAAHQKLKTDKLFTRYRRLQVEYQTQFADFQKSVVFPDRLADSQHED